MNVLVMNPGGNSLKVEIVSCSPNATTRFRGQKAGQPNSRRHREKAMLIDSGTARKPTYTEPMEAKDYGEAAASIFSWLEKEKHIAPQDIRMRRGEGCTRRKKLHRAQPGSPPRSNAKYTNLSASRPCTTKVHSNSSNPSAAGWATSHSMPSLIRPSTAPSPTLLRSMPSPLIWRRNTTSAASAFTALPTVTCWNGPPICWASPHRK